MKMTLFQRLFKRYTGLLRSLKIVYVINNFLNSRALRHNRELYAKYGLRRNIHWPIGHRSFQQHSAERPWIDRPDALARLPDKPGFTEFDAATQEQIRQFITDGYMILKGFYTPKEVAALNDEVDQLLKSGKTGFNYTQRKIMDAHQTSALIDQQYFRNPRLVRLLEFVMGKKVIPFQTINFIEGSEQRAHSDFVHMTTEPEGFLIAAWTALEKTYAGNGPLFYYPGSHRLPFLNCEAYDSGNQRYRLGKNSYKHYEDAVEARIQEHGLKPAYFYAEPGDVLVWHSNLLHGGTQITDAGATRKSMVAHYFCEEVICYHEISQRPALMPGSS